MNHLKVNQDGVIYDTIKRRAIPVRSDGRGYMCCTIDGKTHKAHKIVCLIVYGPKPSLHHVPMHKNNVKTDNRPCNVFWGTRSDNVKHAHESGAMKSTRRRRVRCWTELKPTQFVLERFFDSVNKAASEYDLSPGTIASAASGKSRTAAGLQWEYV
jgi:hypothetical protein